MAQFSVNATNAVDALVIDQTQLKEAAGEWGKTIAGITTAAGIFATYGAGIKFNELTETAQGDLLRNLAFALVFGVVAIVLAFLAQFDDGTGYGTGDLTIKPRGLLYASILAAIVAAFFIAKAPAIAMTGVEEKEAAAVSYFVTLGDDQRAVCGEITPDADGKLFIDGEALTKVTSIEKATDGCPKLAVVGAQKDV
jgi:hypothetical protein